ncbi:MAG: hypothetical protein MHM6MM_000781 [Cercozoa sp. M6MM]
MAANKKMLWIPLESNPDVMTSYCHKLGMKKDFAFHDVFGTDPELLAFVPTPVRAVLLLFPITEASEKFRAEEAQNQPADQGEHTNGDDGVFWMKQTVGNACGTMGLLHALANNRDAIDDSEGNFLSRFFSQADTMDESERAAALEQQEELEEAHGDAAVQGQSAVPEDLNVLLHFTCFVHHNGRLVECDGRKSGPIDHGTTSPDTLLVDSVELIKRNFMQVDPDNVNFSMVALGPSQ